MRSVAAGVVLLLAAVAGCSSSDAAPAEVGPLASGSASASASREPSETGVTPSASGPASVAPRDEQSASYPVNVDGASAFARDYVGLIGRGFADANSAAVRERSAPGCEGCEALMNAMDQAAADGLSQRGGEYKVSTVATPPFEGGDVVLLLTYTRGASDILNNAGDVVDRVPAVPRTTVQMRLMYGPRGWLTQGYRVV